MARLLSAYRAGWRLALLFDYDGTLTPVVGHPDLARLAPATRRLLRRLARLPRAAVGVLSGRGLDDLRGKVGLPGLYYAGVCGLELDLRGRRLTHPGAEACRPLLRAAADGLKNVAASFPGAWVEDKGLGLTLHYRAVECGRRPELLARACRVTAEHAGRLRVVEGPLAWEVTPAVGWDKGSALRQVVAAVGEPVFPVYAGDGANDAEALAAAAALGGLALGVGPAAPPCVRLRVPDPAALAGFLARLAAALADPASAPAT
ncbi:MAG TPA: trehalose-phosphatase [Gemmataceae bacterium]|nr:trehalose-phosphatase [Gemmataceae bacterium]